MHGAVWSKWNKIDQETMSFWIFYGMEDITTLYGLTSAWLSASKLVMLALELSIHMLLKTTQERPYLSEKSYLSYPLKVF